MTTSSLEGARDAAERIRGLGRWYIAEEGAATATGGSRWGAFVRWCDEQQLAALPAGQQTIALYLRQVAPADEQAVREAIGAAQHQAGYDK